MKQRRTNLAMLLALTALVAFAGCSGEPPTLSGDSRDDLLTTPSFNVAVVLSIGDWVWNDVNGNGIQDSGEKGVGGVEVHLMDCEGNTLATTTSDAGGFYGFHNLEPGDYSLGFVIPDGYIATEERVGSDIDVDSDCADDGSVICLSLTDKPRISRDCGILHDDKEEPLGCRVTGGGVDENGNWDGTNGEGRCHRDRYTFGGQAGANTALPPQPKGEWTHHQQRGPSGSFVFHAGTASAPEGTEIARIECMDPGFCNPARPAPAKQIDFWGVGTFKNMKDAPASIADNVVVGESLHWFEVNIDDAGEPGKQGKKGLNGCPDQGFGLHGDVELVDCECRDFYRITIYEGPTDASPVMYQVYGYIFGGNFQIHPLTGYDN